MKLYNLGNKTFETYFSYHHYISGQSKLRGNLRASKIELLFIVVFCSYCNIQILTGHFNKNDWGGGMLNYLALQVKIR